jgi:hypothetical protein
VAGVVEREASRRQERFDSMKRLLANVIQSPQEQSLFRDYLTGIENSFNQTAQGASK